MRTSVDFHTTDVFSYRLTMCLRHRGINVHTLSLAAEVPYNTLKRALAQETIPNGAIIARICTTLCISADWLLGLQNKGGRVKTKPSVQYEVLDRSSGVLVASGDSVACAKQMNIEYVAFLTMAAKGKSGNAVYEVRRVENAQPEPWEREYAASWDRKFGWYLEQVVRAPYPCDQCINRAICDYLDDTTNGFHCASWDRWYQEAFEKSCRRIRRTRI